MEIKLTIENGQIITRAIEGEYTTKDLEVLLKLDTFINSLSGDSDNATTLKSKPNKPSKPKEAKKTKPKKEVKQVEEKEETKQDEPKPEAQEEEQIIVEDFNRLRKLIMGTILKVSKGKPQAERKKIEASIKIYIKKEAKKFNSPNGRINEVDDIQGFADTFTKYIRDTYNTSPSF